MIFGGYSYLRPPVRAEELFICTSTVCPNSALPPDYVLAPNYVTNRRNLNGFEVSGAYHILPFLRLTADFSSHYGSTINNSSSNAHQQFFLFGPEVSLPTWVSPFAHVLIGGSHQSISSGTLTSALPYNTVAANSHTGFSTAIGGGLDLKLIPHVYVRAIQIDYAVTRLNGNTQNDPRISAGLVLHL